MRASFIAISAIALMVADASASEWVMSEQSDPMSDFQNVSFQASAEQQVDFRYSVVTPILVVSCRDWRTSIYVNWRGFVTSGGVDGETQVRFRLDDEPAETDEWDVSTSHEATGMWGRGSLALLREMHRGDTRRFFVSTTPYGEDPVLAEFDTTGIRDVVEAISSRCGWFLPPIDSEPATFLDLWHASRVADSLKGCWQIWDDATLEDVVARGVIRATITDSGDVESAAIVQLRGGGNITVSEGLRESLADAVSDESCQPWPEPISGEWEEADYYIEFSTLDILGSDHPLLNMD